MPINEEKLQEYLTLVKEYAEVNSLEDMTSHECNVHNDDKACIEGDKQIAKREKIQTRLETLIEEIVE